MLRLILWINKGKKREIAFILFEPGFHWGGGGDIHSTQRWGSRYKNVLVPRLDLSLVGVDENLVKENSSCLSIEFSQ